MSSIELRLTSRRESWAGKINELRYGMKRKMSVCPSRFRDHLGRGYATLTALCSKWGISVHEYIRRTKLGYTLKQILTVTKKKVSGLVKAKKSVDHLGVEYPSISAMCKAWHVSPSTYAGRIKRGMSVKEALGSSTTARGTFVVSISKKKSIKQANVVVHSNINVADADVCLLA